MRVELNTSLAIACVGLAVFAAVSGAQAQHAPRRIALKSGESTELRNFYAIQHCQSILIGTPVLDVLQGPDAVRFLHSLMSGEVLPPELLTEMRRPHPIGERSLPGVCSK